MDIPQSLSRCAAEWNNRVRPNEPYDHDYQRGTEMVYRKARFREAPGHRNSGNAVADGRATEAEGSPIPASVVVSRQDWQGWNVRGGYKRLPRDISKS